MTINVAINQTETKQDSNLHFLHQYLCYRFDESAGLNGRRVTPQKASPEILIDIAFLGIPETKSRPGIPEDWRDRWVLPIRISFADVILGPLFRVEEDGVTKPCVRCLETRWLAIRAPELQLALLGKKQQTLPYPNPIWTAYAGEAIYSLLTIMLWSQAANDGKATIYALNLESLKIKSYQLITDPTCIICGQLTADSAEAAAIEFVERPKQSARNYRLVKPEAYNLLEDGLVNPVCGVLGIGAYPDYSNTVTSPVTGQFYVRSKYSVHPAWWSGHANSYRSSRLIGMLEGLERYSGKISRARTVSVFDSYENLKPDAIDPATCGLYQPEFYAKHLHYLPYSPQRKLHWVWGYSMRKKCPVLVPEQMVYYLDRRPDPPNFIQDCSNGCATGSCLEEATLFGLLELIERDAFLLSWFAKLGLKRIDPWSSQDRDTLLMLDRVNRLGYDVFLFDMRLDLPVPAVLGAARRRERGIGNLVFAAGASLDPELAIRSTLDEVASYVPGFDDRVTANLTKLQPMVDDFSKVTELEHHGLLYGLPEMEPHADFLFQTTEISDIETIYQDYSRYEQPRTLDLRDDLNYCINLVLDRDMDVIVVEQTSPEQVVMGMNTASVIVPGMMPMDFGWERQRIWDLPRLRSVPQISGFYNASYRPVPEELPPHPFP